MAFIHGGGFLGKHPSINQSAYSPCSLGFTSALSSANFPGDLFVTRSIERVRLTDYLHFIMLKIQKGSPIIFASFNYRLGPLGFPVGEEARQKGALNLGLKDQLTALEWIKRNIVSFGGDPVKVCSLFYLTCSYNDEWHTGHCLWRKCRCHVAGHSLPQLQTREICEGRCELDISFSSLPPSLSCSS